MSVRSRWLGRLKTRLKLRTAARKRYDDDTAALGTARRKNVHPRTPLVNAQAASLKTLRLRRKQVKAARGVLKRHPAGTGADRAVRWACAQVGTVEQPANSNWGPEVKTWIVHTGYSGPVPWCACFATEAAHMGGAPKLRNGFCPAILAGIGGFVRVQSPRKGDFALFKFPGVSGASADHIGLVVSSTATTVTCVEGNTSSGTGGSQNNGGGVFIRTRPRSLVAGWIRPPYPKG